LYLALCCHIPDEDFAFMPGQDTTPQLLWLTNVRLNTLERGHTRQPHTSTHLKPVTQPRALDSCKNSIQLHCRTPCSIFSNRTLHSESFGFNRTTIFRV
jgi:hypothetical protein